MRKIKYLFIYCITLILSVVCMVFATSCFGFILDTDESIANANKVKLLDCLQEGNHDKIKALFAPKKIADIDDFDKDIDKLLNYYRGEYLSYGKGGPITTTDKHNGNIEKEFNMSFDVTTTEDAYRFHLIWYVEFTADRGNVGIWSLSIIKFDDDVSPETSYGGDGTHRAGINIGKIHVLDYMESMIDCLQSCTPAEFKALFAPNKINGIETIDNDIENLYCFFVGEIQSCSWDTPILYSTENENGVINYYDMTFFVRTAVTRYGFAIRWCVEDTIDNGNVGVWSLYITEYSSEYYKDPYWGDGLWTNGINISHDVF